MKCIKLLLLMLYIFPACCLAQVKTSWDVVELVSMSGQSLKKWNAKSSVSFIDSFLVISCEDNKILGLISHPEQGFFDESGYRIFKLNEPIQSIKDSIGAIYRRSYTSTFYNNNIVIMVDDSLSFVMLHPNPQVGIVLHNKIKK